MRVRARTWRTGIERKSPRELAVMRAAGQINGLALAAAAQVVRPGASTAELDAAAAEVLRKHGARAAFLGVPGPYPYPATTTISVNDELVHGIPGRRRLKAGDVVGIDCGTLLEGYYADSAITLGVGEISPLARQLIEVTRQALCAGIEKMRPGNRTGDVSAAIEAAVRGHAFQVVRDYTGHGIGRTMHEDPPVPNFGVAGRGTLLRPGITIALEPMVLVGTDRTRVLPDRWTVASEDGSLTAHFEHTVAVTEGEPEVLTRVVDEG